MKEGENNKVADEGKKTEEKTGRKKEGKEGKDGRERKYDLRLTKK